MADNEILKFASTDTGTNLLTQEQYEEDTDRDNGHQPGIARSKLENKALRQVSTIAAGVGKFLATHQATNITDDLSADEIAAIIESALAAHLGTTQPKFDASEKIATTQFVQNALGNYFTSSEVSGSIVLDASKAGEFISIRSSNVVTVTLPAIASVPLGASYTLSASIQDFDLVAPGAQIDDLIGTVGNSLAIRQGNIVRVVKVTSSTWFIEGHVQTMPKFNDDTYIATTQFVQDAGLRFKKSKGVQMDSATHQVSALNAGSWFNFGNTSAAILPRLSESPAGAAAFTFRSFKSALIKLHPDDEAAGKKIINQHGTFLNEYSIKAGEFVTIVSNDDYWWITSSGFGSDTFIGGTGYQQLPNGKIIQWGRSSFPGPGTFYATSSTSFPIAFPNTVESVTLNAATQANGTTIGTVASYIPIYGASQFTAFGFTWGCDTNAGIAITGTQVFNWIAVGY